ncbi:MAG: hypothetical protein U0U67_15000 [Chitinophagales bacterium]
MRFLILSFFAIYMSSSIQAQSQLMEAYSYNQLIINEQTRIANEAFYFIKKVDSLNLKILVFQIKKSIKTVENATVFNNETEFQQAAIELFQYYLKTAQTAYPELLKIVEDPDLDYKDFKAKKDAIIKKVADEDKTANEKFVAIQEKYAKKYGIKLE